MLLKASKMRSVECSEENWELSVKFIELFICNLLFFQVNDNFILSSSFSFILFLTALMSGWGDWPAFVKRQNHSKHSLFRSTFLRVFKLSLSTLKLETQSSRLSDEHKSNPIVVQRALKRKVTAQFLQPSGKLLFHLNRASASDVCTIA